MTLLDKPAIKDMWSQRAAAVGADDQVTHRDVSQRAIEIETLLPHINPNDEVLDMGCGNGWTTVRLAPHCKTITGVDYSDQMIARARAEHGTVANARWQVGDVLCCDEIEQYDVVVTVRCLINIVDWSEQQKAMANLARAVRPGGKFLMMEGLADGREGINVLRQAVGLKRMPSVTHNLDFRIEQTSEFLKTLFNSVELHVNGTYDLITRVLYPLMIAPDDPQYSSGFHDAAKMLQLAMADDAEVLPSLSRFGLFVCGN